MVDGTFPSNPSRIWFAMMTRSLAFVRKKPVERMISSTSSTSAAAISTGVGYFSNSAGVTMFTRASVHWADRRTATSNWYGSS